MNKIIKSAVIINFGFFVFFLSSPLSATVDGTALYQQHCAKCHGDTGRADSWRGYLYFARNFSDPSWQAAKSDAYILDKINTGPRIMPAYSELLTLDERQALVRVVRGFNVR